MSELAQHILTWNCPSDEGDEIRKAVRECGDRGKFKDVYPTPSGIQFRAGFKVVPPFLRELSGQHPGIRFTQEWASASHMDAGTQTYLSGKLISGHSHMPEQYANEIWSRAADNEAASAFRCKVEENWREYRQDLLSLPKDDLIDKAGDIAAVRLTKEVLTSPSLDREAWEYLDRFVDPLEVVSDSWLSEQEGDMSAAIDHALWELHNRQDAEQDYELEPEYQSHEPGQSM